MVSQFSKIYLRIVGNADVHNRISDINTTLIGAKIEIFKSRLQTDMEDRKFNLLLHDVKSGKYNVNRIQILECYVAQRFTVTQILLLLQPLTTSDAKLKGFSLLVKEMLACKGEEAICLVSSLGTDPKHIDNQLICLGELLKHKKAKLDESEKLCLFALFEGTTAEEEACKLLKITPQSIPIQLPAQHQMPPVGAIFHPRSRTPDQLPIASDSTPGLRQATATTTDTFSQYPQVKTNDTPGQPSYIIPSGTPDQPPHTIPSGIPGQHPHTIPSGTPGQHFYIIPSGTPDQHPHTIPSDTPGQPPYTIHSDTPGQPPYTIPSDTPGQPPHTIPSGTPQPPHTFEQLPHTLQRGTLGQYPYSMPNTGAQPPKPPVYHNFIPNYPYRMYGGPHVPQFPANVVNPIGFIVSGDTPHPLQPQTTFPSGPPPGLGFTVQL